MRAVVFLLLAGSVMHFDITDARGKKPSGVTIEEGSPDADGWYELKVAGGKGEPVLIWPFDGSAKLPDGSGAVPAIVIQRGDEKALMNPHVVAAIAAPVVMGMWTIEQSAQRTGLSVAALNKAFADLESSKDPFDKGVGLLRATKGEEAADQLAVALKDRQRQLTRVPSEIYPVAMLYGDALMLAGKFDAASVQRPSDACAVKSRADALVRAGKREAADLLLNSGAGKSRAANPCFR